MALLESPSPPQEVGIFGVESAPSMGDADADRRMDVLVSDYGWRTATLAAVGAAYVLGFDTFLTADAREVSAAAGGTVRFTLDFPAAEAGRGYLLLASDDQPGSIELGGVGIPLVDSPLLRRMVLSPPPVFDAPSGTLDAAGDAVVTATLAPNSLAAYVGRTVKFAAVSLLAPAQPSLSSAAAWVEILP
jgi:hypothetical protein